MKKIVFILALTVSSNVGFAQAPAWEWAKGIGGSDGDGCSSVTTDELDNVYTTGLFSGTVDFNPGVDIFSLSAIGDQDLFISKLDNAGNFIWSKSCGGTLRSCGTDIKIDAAGNVYISGWFQGTVDFNPGVGIFNLTATGNFDAFICKLDSNGNFLWAKGFLGTNFNIVISISLDDSGNVYATGKFDGTVDYDPGPATYNFSSYGYYDMSIFKLDPSGNFVWAKQIGGAGSGESNSVSLDAHGNVYTAGKFSDTTDFDPGIGVYSVAGAGTYILKLSCSSGNFIWVRTLVEGAGSVEGYSMAIDNEENIFYAGGFEGAIDFNSGAGTFNLTSLGDVDIFISKLDSTGNFIWVKQMGATIQDVQCAFELVLDNNGNVYATGRFATTVDFDPGVNIYNLSPVDDDDIFIVALDNSGNFIYAKGVGGDSQEWGNAIAVDNSNNVFIACSFQSEYIDFGSITIVNADNSQNTDDILIAKLAHINIGIENLPLNLISLFPNPTTDNLTIQFNAPVSKGTITLTNTLGEVVYTAAVTEQTFNCNIQSLASGIYFVQVVTDKGSMVKKVVKE